MADFGQPVANTGTYDPQSGLKTLGAIYNIKSAQAEAQQQQQTAGQRYGIAQWVKNFDPAKHVAADGTLNLDAVLSDPGLRSAAGDQYPEVVSQFINLKQGQLQNKQALINVNDAARKGFQETISALRTDPDVTADNEKGRQKLQEAIGQFAAQGPDNARIAGIYGPQAENVPQGKLAQYLSNVQLQAEDAATQAAKQAPDLQNVGGKLINVNPQAAGAGEGGGPTLTSSSPVTVKPPAGFGAFQDQGGNTWFFNQQNPKEIFPASEAGKGGNSAAPGAPAIPAKPSGPAFMPVGAVENAKQGALNDEDLYNKVILPAGNKAPVIKSALLNIQKLADTGVLTGAGSENLAQIEGLMGQFGLKGAGDAATDRQLMGKYTQQLAMQLTESNYGTDQAKSMVEHAIPNADNMTPQAMKAAAQYVYGQQEIAEARANLANQYKQKHNSTVGLRQIDSQFMQNVDPRMFDLISMPADKQADYIKKNFKSKQEWDSFKERMGIISYLGGFNPVSTSSNGSGTTGTY